MLSQTNFLMKIIKFGVYLSLLTPLVAWDQVIYPFVFPKIIFFRIVVEILIFLSIALCLSDKKYYPKITPLSIALGFYLAIATLTSLMGADIFQSFFSTLARGEGLITLYHLYALFIIASSIFQTKDEWIPFLLFLFLIFFIENILALGQTLQLSYVKMFGANRPNGSLGNPAFFASFEALGIWITYLLYTVIKKKNLKIIFIVTIIISAINLYYTVNRASALGLMAGIVIFFLLEIMRVSDTQAKKKYFKIILAIPVLIAIIHFASPDSSIINKLTNYSKNDPSIKNRLIGWNIGWMGFKERPILGWGNENFSYIFNTRFNPEIVADSGSYTWFDRAHNTLIEVASANGIFGLLAFLAIYIFAFFMIIKSDREKKEKNILIAFFITQFTINFFIFDTIATLIFFYLMLGYINSDQRQEKQGALKRIIKRFHSDAAPLKQRAKTITALFLILIITYFINVRPLRATLYASKLAIIADGKESEIVQNFTKAFAISPASNYELREILGNYILKKITEGNDIKKLEPLILFAIDNMKKTALASPHNISARITLAELARIESELNPYFAKFAEQESLAIIQESPMRYQPYLTLGKLRFTQGRNADGIEFFKKAVGINPKFVGARWNLALGYIYEQDFEKAKNEIALMETIEPTYIYDEKNIIVLSNILKKQKQYDIAIQLYLNAIHSGIRPSALSPYYYELGNLYTLTGEKDLAQKAFDAADNATTR
ncbi:MAG: O-antigen polymerase [Parcubacteria group bacterium GW2011_GWA2_38_13]|nr:MAG: O-antigen polymerase [Parcubacteria group bacterium GW2011_GWA2_38_13]